MKQSTNADRIQRGVKHGPVQQEDIWRKACLQGLNPETERKNSPMAFQSGLWYTVCPFVLLQSAAADIVSSKILNKTGSYWVSSSIAAKGAEDVFKEVL